jgi:prepilin peptidase CpaA
MDFHGLTRRRLNCTERPLMRVLGSPIFWPVVVLIATAVCWDLRERRIPNWLTLPFLCAGFCAAPLMHGWAGLKSSLLAAPMVALIAGVFWLMGGLGAGDLKLLTAVAAWVGVRQSLSVLVMTALAGGVVAAVWAIAAGLFMHSLRGVGELLRSFGRQGLRPHEELNLKNPLSRKIPYAPSIAIGTILSFCGKG